MNDPERSLVPPEDRRRVVGACTACGEEIRVGDTYYTVDPYGDRMMFCADCVRKNVAEEDDLY